MAGKKRREPVRESGVFTCLLCPDGVDVPGEEYKRHREEVHGLTEHKGIRTAVSHADAKDWFIWTYTWSENTEDRKVFAFQTVKTPRRPMKWHQWPLGLAALAALVALTAFFPSRFDAIIVLILGGLVLKFGSEGRDGPSA